MIDTIRNPDLATPGRPLGHYYLLVATPGDNDLIDVMEPMLKSNMGTHAIGVLRVVNTAAAVEVLSRDLVAEENHRNNALIIGSLRAMKHRRLALDRLIAFRDSCDPSD